MLLLLLGILFSFSIVYLVTKDHTLISLVHALITSYFACTNIPYILYEDVSKPSAPGRLSVSITVTYMFFDILFTYRWSYVFHHTLALMCGIYVLYYDHYTTLVLFMDINEVSTVFMNLVKLRIHEELSKKCFVFTFFICRILWIAWMLIYKNVNNDYLKCALVLHYMLNVYWFAKIVQKVRSEWNL